MRSWAVVIAGYLALAVALTWPLALHLGDGLVGYPQVDQMDTTWLRGAFASVLADPLAWPHSDAVLAPTGYPVGLLAPNVVDHLLGAPLALALPWPLSDNLWWILVIAGNGLAAHLLGKDLGGDSHAAGALCGVAFACAEPVLREANLGHAPQALLWAAPLYLRSLVWALSPDGGMRHAVAMGLWMAIAASTYWYMGLFLAVLSLPPFLVSFWRPGVVPRVVVAVVVCAVCCVPAAGLLAQGWSALPSASFDALPPIGLPPEAAGVPAAERWAFAHGGDVWWAVRAVPFDLSNRVGLVLCVAAALGLWRSDDKLVSAGLVASVALGGVLLMGPYLKLGDAPMYPELVPLPFHWLSELHPALARLTWPQRFGIVVPLALLPLAAWAPRPAWFVPFVLAEAFALSGNAPLQWTPVSQVAPWSVLAEAGGAAFVVPLDRVGPRAGTLAYAARAARVPLAAAVALPPGAPKPEAWDTWRRENQLAEWLARRARGKAKLPEAALAQLRDQGFVAIVVDSTPGGAVPTEQGAQAMRWLSDALGPGEDHGALVVWWLGERPAGAREPMTDGDGWRAEQVIRLGEHAWPVEGSTRLRIVRPDLPGAPSP